jgi:hypothetical protein
VTVGASLHLRGLARIQYVLNRDKYQRLIKLKGKLVCKKCSKELKIGDSVNGNRNSGTSKLYHSDCYDKLFIDLDTFSIRTYLPSQKTTAL